MPTDWSEDYNRAQEEANIRRQEGMEARVVKAKPPRKGYFIYSKYTKPVNFANPADYKNGVLDKRFERGDHVFAQKEDRDDHKVYDPRWRYPATGTISKIISRSGHSHGYGVKFDKPFVNPRGYKSNNMHYIASEMLLLKKRNKKK